MNFEITSFLDGDIEIAVQSCVTVEQKELLEELAESVGATTTVEAYEKKILLRRRYC
ncbi:Peptide chain release factor apg3, chloroplastic [Dionaea muscipula]